MAGRLVFLAPVALGAVLGITTITACAAALESATATASTDEATVFVTSPFSSGPGSIREAIEKANASPTIKRIVSRLGAGTVVHVFRQLPTLSARGVELEAGGLTLKGGSCLRSDGRRGCDGLVVGGPGITVRRLRATGFTFDGIAVRGSEANRVRIEECESFENQDDGVGVSHGATEALIVGCRLERNGFRTKGKGALVFDYSSAELRDNTITGNRDGVTVSKRSRAKLIGNRIVDNYDKGLGVAGAEATGRDNVIARNGIRGPNGEPGPNADGVRVTIDSTVILENCEIVGNGDIGVVVLGSSTVSLTGGRITGHSGAGVHARERSVVELRGVEIADNGAGAFRIDGEAKLVRSDAR